MPRWTLTEQLAAAQRRLEHWQARIRQMQAHADQEAEKIRILKMEILATETDTETTDPR